MTLKQYMQVYLCQYASQYKGESNYSAAMTQQRDGCIVTARSTYHHSIAILTIAL